MSEPTSKQDSQRGENGQLLPGAVLNPEGKGGFKDHPENRSDGRWSKDNSFSYWMNYFKSLSTKDFLAWEKTPNSEKSVAADLAYTRVRKARANLKEFEAVADRTEGRPRQSVDVTTGGEKLTVTLVEFVSGPDDSETSTNT